MMYILVINNEASVFPGMSYKIQLQEKNDREVKMYYSC